MRGAIVGRYQSNRHAIQDEIVLEFGAWISLRRNTALRLCDKYTLEAEALKSGADSGRRVIFGRHCRPKFGSNFMDADMAGAVEGSSHLIADTMRRAGGTDASAIHGFRYGTHVPTGWPITMEDVYRYIPAGRFFVIPNPAWKV